MATRYQYIFELIAKTKEAEQNMQQAGNKAREMVAETTKVEGSSSKFNRTLGAVGSGIGSLILKAGGAVGAITFLASAINSVEGPADTFEAAIGGAKGSLFEFQRMLVSLDFDDFFRNLVDGYKHGKKFADMLDELADKSAYNDYVVAGLRRQSEELAETIKNKQLDISVRADAAKEREKIELQIQERTNSIAKKAFIIQKQNWEDLNNMSADEALMLYERIDSMNSDLTEKLDSIFDKADKTFKGKDLFGAKRAFLMQQGISSGIPENVIKDFAKFRELLKSGQSDVLVKLFGTFKNIEEVMYQSQSEYNSKLRETSMLLNQEDRQVDKLTNNVSGLGDAEAKAAKEAEKAAAALQKVKDKYDANPIREAALPSLNQAGKDLVKSNIPQKFESTWSQSLTNVGNIAQNTAGAFSTLFDTIQNASEDGSVSFGEAMNIISQAAFATITVLASLAAANIITKESVKGVIGIATAVAGLTMLAGVWSTFVSGSKISKMAEGGLAYGDTVVRVGEYANARSNPEVITPLNKLRDMIQPALTEGTVRFEIGDRVLVGILQRSARIQKSIRG